MTHVSSCNWEHLSEIMDYHQWRSLLHVCLLHVVLLDLDGFNSCALNKAAVKSNISVKSLCSQALCGPLHF